MNRNSHISESRTTTDQFVLSPFIGASIIGALAGVLAAVVIFQPILTLALAIATGFATLSWWRPNFALKFALFFGGIPLERLGESKINTGEKPLLQSLGGTTVDGLSLVALCLALTLVLWNARPIAVPKHFRSSLVFLGFLAFSLIYSTAPLEGVRVVLKIAYPILIFLTVLRFVQTSKEAESASWYWIAGGIAATVSGATLFVLQGPEAFVRLGDFRYSSGLMYDGPFSIYMFSLFVFCYAIWRTEGKRHYGALAAVFGFQAIAAQTRITWAAVLVGVLVLEGTRGEGMRRVVRTTCIAAVAGLIAFYMIWHSPQVQHRMFAGDFDQSVSAGEAVEQLNLTSRVSLWADLYEDYVAHNLWVGQGAGSSMVVIRRDFPLTIAAPHNEYLRVLHDAGVLGLLLFLVTIASFFAMLRSLSRSRSGTRQRLFVRISLALLSGYAITAITDNPLDYYLVFSQYVFFVMALAVVAPGGHTMLARGAPSGFREALG